MFELNKVSLDRKKNIIRRSGENISSAEIEATSSGLTDIISSKIFKKQINSAHLVNLP